VTRDSEWVILTQEGYGCVCLCVCEPSSHQSCVLTSAMREPRYKKSKMNLRTKQKGPHTQHGLTATDTEVAASSHEVLSGYLL
jgi:hypothetical protein